MKDKGLPDPKQGTWHRWLPDLDTGCGLHCRARRRHKKSWAVQNRYMLQRKKASIADQMPEQNVQTHVI